MAILDAGLTQDWINAFDKWDRAQRRYEAAGRMGNAALVDYLRKQVEGAGRDLNEATKAING